MGRTPCCSGEHAGLKKGPWTHEEDEKLKSFLLHQPNTSWRLVPKKSGLIRCGKSCRLRWMNYLRPDIRRGNFTEEEENIIIQLHSAVGNKWSIIAGRLPGRTDNEIKNLWNTKLRKLLVLKGINPITHQPLCNPLLSDYVKHWVKSIENMLIMGLATSSLPDTNAISNNNNNNSSSSNNSCVDVGVVNLNMSAPSWLPRLPLQTLASGLDNLNFHNTEPSAMKMNCMALDDSSPHSSGNLCDNPVFGGDSFFAGNFSFMREEFDESTDLAGLGSMHSSSLPAGFEEALKYWD